jgi:alkyl hydroperoxide reductase subunit AhpC
MPAYEEDLPEFARYDAQVVGIDVDNHPTNGAWGKSMGGISHPLLSDFWPQGMVATKYQVLRPEGITERALFIVDKQGKVAYIDIHDINKQPDNAELFKVLRTLQR